MPRWENIRPIWNVETEMIKKSGLEICKILLDFKLKILSHYEIVYFFVNSLNSIIAILEKFRYLLKKKYLFQSLQIFNFIDFACDIIKHYFVSVTFSSKRSTRCRWL